MADGSSAFLPFDQELVVDLFAGGGGASTGIARAYREPDVAVNHDAIAIAVHRANHPNTEHHQADVFEVDPLTATRGRPVGLLWASPDCRHHSKAKGGAPRSKRIRGLAWVILRWAVVTRPRVIEIENVEEFKDWGPLGEDGQAIKARKGETYRAFVAAMTTGLPADHPAMAEILEFLGSEVHVDALIRGLGYAHDDREIRACTKGTPTIRKRLVVKFRCDGQPITWSRDTHGAPDSPAVLAGRLKPYRTAAECIDFDLPACSIFATKDEAKLWARAIGMRGTPKRPLERPTKRRIAKGIWKHVLTVPKPYIVPLRGTSAAHTSTHGTDAPLSTVSGGGTHHALAAPVLTEFANASNQRTFAVNESLRTQVAQVKGGHFAMATAHLTAFGQNAIGSSLAEPAQTALAGAARYGLVAAHIVKFRHDSAGSSVAGPVPTVTAGGDMARPAGAAHALGIASAYLEQANGGFYDGAGRDLRDPTSTVLQSGSHQQLVTAYLVKFYKSGGQWADCGESMHTVPTKDRMGLVQVVNVHADILAPELLERARQVAHFMHEHLPEHFPEKADMVLVGDRVMVDITLRMLVPRELARANGFPDAYILDRGLFETEPGSGVFEWRPVSKTDQVRLIGNAVCPDMAEAEIANDLAPLIRMYAEAA
jgi:DNA (cytosine-5)-methyltransferase 1